VGSVVLRLLHCIENMKDCFKRLEVIVAVRIGVLVLGVVTSSRPEDTRPYFGETYCLHLQPRRWLGCKPEAQNQTYTVI
jgi:hypothetical protein